MKLTHEQKEASKLAKEKAKREKLLNKNLAKLQKIGERQAEKSKEKYAGLIRLAKRKAEQKSEHCRQLQEAIEYTTSVAIRLAQGDQKWDSNTVQAFKSAYCELILGTGFVFDKIFSEYEVEVDGKKETRVQEKPVYYGFTFSSACNWLAMNKVHFNSMVAMVLKQLSRSESLEQECKVYAVPNSILSISDYHDGNAETTVRKLFIQDDVVQSWERITEGADKCDKLQSSLNRSAMFLAKIIDDKDLFNIVDTKGYLLKDGYQWIWHKVNVMCREKFMESFRSKLEPMFASTVEVKILHIPPKKNKTSSRYAFSAVVDGKKKRVLVPKETADLFGQVKPKLQEEISEDSEY